MARHLFYCAAVPLFGIAAACGSDESPIAISNVYDGDGSASSGGKSGSGGSRSGGATGRGGSNAGGGNTGGSSAGGSSGAGGLSAGGADAGAGGSNAGGSSGTGGATSTGGMSSDAGLDGSSGAGGANTDGSIGSGGTNADGSSGAGGASTGGATATGGNGGTGGASTGGASNDAGPTSSTVFVNPTTGDNANSGLSSAQAVKWITKAAEIARTLPNPRTILLEDGTYNQATQLNVGWYVPAGTTVRSVSAAGVTLHGTVGATAFSFEGEGAVRNVTFDGYGHGVQVFGTGTFDMSDVHFIDVIDPMEFFDSIVATVDAGVTGTFAVPPATGFGPACLFAGGSAAVTFRNGVFQNVPGNDDGDIFKVQGNASLTIDNTVIYGSNVRAISMWENTHVVLMNSEIHRVSLTTTGPAAAAIFLGGQGGTQPIDYSLDVVNSDILLNQVPGVSMIVYGAFASKPVVKFTDSHIEGNTGSGFVVSPIGGVHSGVVNTVQVVDSTFNGNTLAGITMPVGAVTITGGEFSRNGGHGVALTGTAHANSLRVRGTKIEANEEDGIFFNGTAGSSLDLGTSAAAGEISFSTVAVGHSAVNLQAPIQGVAVGNTWIPNVQGASAAGLFTTPTTITGPASGLNATVVGGGGLIVAQ
jgi:hypothetical protein